MTVSVIVGSAGVGILLVAFVLNLTGRLRQESRAYALLNFVGAGIACYASILIDYVPFVVLEGTWAAVALVGLIKAGGKKEG